MAKKVVVKGYTIGEGSPIVCVPVIEPTHEGIVEEVKRLVDQGEQMIEWRVDGFDGYHDLNQVRAVFESLAPIVTKTILLFTYRSRGQGGRGDHNKTLIEDLHEIAAESGVADIVDIEYFAARKPKWEIRKLQKMGVKVIASHHDEEETPRKEVIDMLLEQEFESGADIVQMAMWAKDMEDVLILLNSTYTFHKEHKNLPVFTMSMGPIGSISRVAGEYFGSCFTFGCGKTPSAPGQLPEHELHLILDALHRCI